MYFYTTLDINKGIDDFNDLGDFLEYIYKLKCDASYLIFNINEKDYTFSNINTNDFKSQMSLDTKKEVKTVKEKTKTGINNLFNKTQINRLKAE